MAATTSDRPVNVTASPHGVTAACAGNELKASGMPLSMIEFAAALEQFANWAYHKGLAKAAYDYAAKEESRRRQDEGLLASVRKLVGKTEGK